MIILNSTSDTLNLLLGKINTLTDSIRVINNKVNDISDQTGLVKIYYISQIAGILFLVGYATVTYLMYRQIRRQTIASIRQSELLAAQTNLLTDAKLTFEFVKYNGLQEFKSKFKGNEILESYINKSESISTRLATSLRPYFNNITETIFQSGIYALVIKNHGNSAVKVINLHLDVTIQHSEDVLKIISLKSPEKGDCDFNIEKQIQAKELIVVPIICIGSFPIFKLEIRGNYVDIRNKAYEIDKGIIEDKNSYLLSPPSTILPDTKPDPKEV